MARRSYRALLALVEELTAAVLNAADLTGFGAVVAAAMDALKPTFATSAT
ncbi:hypothetical protein [Streptomyces sp. NPDC001415]